MYRDTVAPSTAVANCQVKPTDAWQINQSDCRLAGDRVGDRDAPQREPTQEIVGPINRIDDPAALSCFSPAPLPEKPILRKGFGQARADQRLDLAVGNTDEVLRPLRLARQGRATCEKSSGEVPASRISWVATVRRASIVMVARRPPVNSAIAWARR